MRINYIIYILMTSRSSLSFPRAQLDAVVGQIADALANRTGSRPVPMLETTLWGKLPELRRESDRVLWFAVSYLLLTIAWKGGRCAWRGLFSLDGTKVVDGGCTDEAVT